MRACVHKVMILNRTLIPKYFNERSGHCFTVLDAGEEAQYRTTNMFFLINSYRTPQIKNKRLQEYSNQRQMYEILMTSTIVDYCIG